MYKCGSVAGSSAGPWPWLLSLGLPSGRRRWRSDGPAPACPAGGLRLLPGGGALGSLQPPPPRRCPRGRRPPREAAGPPLPPGAVDNVGESWLLSSSSRGLRAGWERANREGPAAPTPRSRQRIARVVRGSARPVLGNALANRFPSPRGCCSSCAGLTATKGKDDLLPQLRGKKEKNPPLLCSPCFLSAQRAQTPTCCRVRSELF